ncbi:MAG TPA: hypothetical protein VJN02_05805 [Gammaproteobacteria bacterium]|nr:hypothetical protein [Gammaproteobacteria bacterium]
MLMFVFHITIFLGLIALVAGVYLFTWSSKIENKCYKVFAWILGLIVTILSILGLFCTGMCGIQYQRAGYFEKPMMTRMMDIKNKSTMNTLGMPSMMDQKSKKN